MTRRLPAVAALAWLAIIAWVTLQPHPEVAQLAALTPWSCVVCGDAGVSDVLLNVLLFAPLGLLLRAAGWRLVPVALVALACTVAIEASQAGFVAGRDASVGDVLANFSGALVGWIAFRMLATLRRPSTRAARLGAGLAVGTSAMVWFATTAGLQPALTDAAPWYGQPAFRRANMDTFPGAIWSATLLGIAIENAPMQRMPLKTDSVQLEFGVTLTSNRPTRRAASILRIVDGRQRVQVDAVQRGRDLVLETRVRASDWKLHTPAWRYRDALAVPTGAQLAYRWTSTPHGMQLQRALRAESITTVIAPRTAGSGWVLIHPFVADIGQHAAWWTAAWLAWWFGVAGWLSGAAGIRFAIAAGVVAISTFVAASISARFAVSGDEVAVASTIFGVMAAVAARRRMRGGDGRRAT